MKLLPDLEDVHWVYFTYLMDTFFPKKGKNKWIVYPLSLLHIIGTFMITMGVLFAPNYQPLYLFYILIILLCYPLFNGYCFMTLLCNKYSGLKNSPLYIKLNTAKTVLIINILLSILSIIKPNYSIYFIIRYLFS